MYIYYEYYSYCRAQKAILNHWEAIFNSDN